MHSFPNSAKKMLQIYIVSHGNAAPGTSEAVAIASKDPLWMLRPGQAQDVSSDGICSRRVPNGLTCGSVRPYPSFGGMPAHLSTSNIASAEPDTCNQNIKTRTHRRKSSRYTGGAKRQHIYRTPFWPKDAYKIIAVAHRQCTVFNTSRVLSVSSILNINFPPCRRANR